MAARNSLTQVFFDRGVRLAAGLAVVVAIPMAVLFYFQFKSLDDLEETSEVVLRQLSSDTADSLTRAIEDYLKRPHISVLLRITQARTEPIDLSFIEPVFNDGLVESPFVESFYVWSERGPHSNKWLVFDQASKSAGAGGQLIATGRAPGVTGAIVVASVISPMGVMPAIGSFGN